MCKSRKFGIGGVCCLLHTTKLSVLIGAKLDESHEEAIDVITNVLRDVSANEQLAYQPHSPGSVLISILDCYTL